MGTHLRVLSEGIPIITNMTGFRKICKYVAKNSLVKNVHQNINAFLGVIDMNGLI